MKTSNNQKIRNWGNYPEVQAEITNATGKEEAAELLRQNKKFITRGLGRSYGDASLGNCILSTPEQLNRFLRFDNQAGILKAEAGVSLAEILEVIIPEGWFLPVTPGTCFVTLGGAVASDVHGKNHHLEGSFGDYVEELEMVSASGETVVCSPRMNKTLLEATCGGMGLTGVILSVTIRLKKIETAYIRQNNYPARNLDEIFRHFETHKNTTYSVAWLDCLSSGKNLGRSILMAGEHATINQLKTNKHKINPLQLPEKKGPAMPFFFPQWVLNRYSVSAFNQLYYMRNRSLRDGIVSYKPYFYPLDNIRNWNRMYGRKGFVQYQFVLPLNNSYEGMKAVLQEVSTAGMGSFLSVLKLMGPSDRPLSFPMEGYTLALDFPVNQKVFQLLNKLDDLVAQYSGRCYLAKDARMGKSFFQQGYPRLDEFKQLRKDNHADSRLASLQSERLGI